MRSPPFPEHYVYRPSAEPRETPRPARFETWRWFCDACNGMTVAQIEEATGFPFGTILSWSVHDKIPESAYIAVRDFPGEKRRFGPESKVE